MDKNEIEYFVRWVIENEKWQYLYVKQKSNWKTLFPWWKMEKWESISQAVSREIFEETWLIVKRIEDILRIRTFEDSEWKQYKWFYCLCTTEDLNFENKEKDKLEDMFWWDKNLTWNWLT